MRKSNVWLAGLAIAFAAVALPAAIGTESALAPNAAALRPFPDRICIDNGDGTYECYDWPDVPGVPDVPEVEPPLRPIPTICIDHGDGTYTCYDLDP